MYFFHKCGKLKKNAADKMRSNIWKRNANMLQKQNFKMSPIDATFRASALGK